MKGKGESFSSFKKVRKKKVPFGKKGRARGKKEETPTRGQEKNSSPHLARGKKEENWTGFYSWEKEEKKEEVPFYLS